jgi:membrane protein required for colicin V production
VNALDIFAILVIALFFGLGIYHGLIKSISSLASILLGLFLANKLSPALAEILSYIHIPNSRGLVGFLIVFFFFFLVIKILFHFIQKLSNKSGLSVVDRVMGGILGLAKGLIITVFVFTFLQLVLPQSSAILKESNLLSTSNKVFTIAKGIVPHDIYTHILRSKK